jgi:formylglycine-generating enzyme required for sulfatase activity
MSNTIICLNQDCLTVNSINHKFCEKCGEKVLLKDRYQAVKLIGQGGFGRTFLARDLDKPSKPYCVIKQFFPSAQGTNNIEKASELFAQEAERLEQLGKHPQIPELFAYFVTDDGQQYLVQEYVAGENLLEELKNHGVYREAEVKDLLIEILNILKFVHENQVIHRDIKPDNIIRRNSDQKLVLVDFGAAKYIRSQSALNVTGTVIGSAQYCSPEQARGKPIFASDLYSLGVTCIHLLTQVDAFQLFDISENDWVWRDYLVDNPVSEQFGQVLDQLIAMGLKKRFANVQEIFNCLGYKYGNDKYLDQKSLSETSNTQLQSALAITNQNQPKIETVEFYTTIIKEIRKGFLGIIGKEVITEHKKAICQIIRFDLDNRVQLEMVYIPGGIFYMGSNELECEKPIHIVNIKPFYLGKYPLTQAQYQAIMGDNPSLFKGLNRPVEKVSWDMAQVFCQKLSEKVGHKFSLPSESQWEYACRAGTTTPFYCGETITTDFANYDGRHLYGEEPEGVYRKETTNVGSFPRNAFGLYDMYGNVQEWCEDSWHKNYIGHPNDGSVWMAEDNQVKVLRSGSWINNPFVCRSSSRNYSGSTYIYHHIGFRVSCEIL